MNNQEHLEAGENAWRDSMTQLVFKYAATYRAKFGFTTSNSMLKAEAHVADINKEDYDATGNVKVRVAAVEKELADCPRDKFDSALKDVLKDFPGWEYPLEA